MSWLSNADVPSVDSLSRKIIALHPAGVDVSPYLKQLMAWKNTPGQATWGAYDHLGTSFPDTPLALNAIRVSGYSYPGQINELDRSVFCHILWSQYANVGSWPYFEMADSRQIPSFYAPGMLPMAHNVLELIAIKAATGWDSRPCVENRQVAGVTWVPQSLTTAINAGATWMLTKKNADGGFGDGGVSTVLETAIANQVVRVMAPVSGTATGIVDYFIARQAVDGSWNGSALQTAWVLKTLPAPSVALTDSDTDGIPDAIETILGTNPAVIDNRWLAN